MMDTLISHEELSVLISSQEKYHDAIRMVMARYGRELPGDLADELAHLRENAQNALENAKGLL